MGRDLTFLNVNGVKVAFTDSKAQVETKGSDSFLDLEKSGNNPWLIKDTRYQVNVNYDSTRYKRVYRYT
jgi:hypothetical protein